LLERLLDDPAAFFATDGAAVRFFARVGFLRRLMPELGLPPFDPPQLAQVLAAACPGAVSLAQVRARGLRRLLENQLTSKQRAALDNHAPEALAVPSGSRIRLQYPADPGQGPPILAVRLQELFGLAETPRLAAGRVSVLLHLLGPNFRPVQVTTDLRSFWRGAYAEARKDLRARYPRHPWPEDPWNAPPVAVGRRRTPKRPR
jgi:ATP-dependent helicase HrpB